MVDLDPELLEILACPACKSPLRVDDSASELVCTSPDCGLAYPVRDEIPVLLVEEARRPVDGDEADDSGAEGGADDADAGGEPQAAAEAEDSDAVVADDGADGDDAGDGDEGEASEPPSSTHSDESTA